MKQIVKTLVVSSNWITDLKEAYRNVIGGRLKDYESIIDKELQKEIVAINQQGYEIQAISASQITTGAVVFTIIGRMPE